MNAPAPLGHNETTVRLGLLAEDARRGLERVARGEADALEGWLAYGAALNEGRALFPGDREFGEWVALSQLDRADWMERAAAMWAAANPDQFAEARASGNARTVRGIHAKWKELEDERKAVEARARAAEAEAHAEIKRREEAEAKRQAAEAEDEARREEAERRAVNASLEREAAEERAREARDGAMRSRAFDAVLRDRELVFEDSFRERLHVHVAQNSGNNEWYTPPSYIEAARRVMGGIDLDPATSEIANRTVRAGRIFTAEDDGLAQEWPVGRVWMNPPYAQPLIGQFSEKLAAEVEKGSEAIVLVNNATETAWFQRLAEVSSAICFPRGRIRFVDPSGEPSGAPLQGQAVIYCGPNAAAFIAEFASFGFVVTHG